MTYPGGKNGAGVYQTIINHMPPHRVYIEPFLGSAAIMRQKRPALLNIGIDCDPAAIEAGSCIAENGEGGFRLEAGDALAFLTAYPFTGDELVYCDPPYLFNTRSSDRAIYAYELGDDRHPPLLDILTGLPCMVMVSGYWSQLYADRLTGWNSIQFQAMTRGGRPATEWLWFNFPPPVALHDYGFLGSDFRQRERIKRKKQRWTERLHRLPLLERQALLAAIEEAWPVDPIVKNDEDLISVDPIAGNDDAAGDTARNGDDGRHRPF
jgi:DNA adenine methylase